MTEERWVRVRKRNLRNFDKTLRNNASIIVLDSRRSLLWGVNYKIRASRTVLDMLDLVGRGIV